MAASTDTLLETMPTRQLGSTDWQASVLTLGGVKWDTQLPEDDAIALVHRAIELGVNTFDTAAGYGRGQSEERLGKALVGHRDSVWINTKTGKRDYDGAKQQLDTSLKRLRTDAIDLYFIHSLEDDADLAKTSDPEGVLKVIDEYKRAGHIRHAGVSGHHYKHNMIRFIESQQLDAVLLPAGLFNMAYDYTYSEEVIPAARRLNMAVLGMKVFGAGRVKHAESVEPYLRYSLGQDLDTLVIGCDSIAQLEQTIGIIKSEPDPLPPEEAYALRNEAVAVTQSWDTGEFAWVNHYVEVNKSK